MNTLNQAASAHDDNAPSYDIAICGAGPAGMALAALLARRGTPAQRIALIDAKTLEQASNDPRSIALSWGSRQILEEIGAWPAAATAIHQIHVSRRSQFGRSLIDRDEHKLPALGYVLRYGDLVTALGTVCQRAGIATLRPARVEAIAEGADAVALTIAGAAASTGATPAAATADATAITAAIVVQAEGGLFSDQESKAQHRDYQQTAIIAQVRSSRPIAHRAYERFTEQGPLALLPQGEEYSLVWCVRPETAARLQALDDATFLAELGAAFGERLGTFTRSSPRLAFPLGLNADPRSTARTVAIGNAAQTLHPVAGQGLNLGLRDVAVLARLLAQGANPSMLAQFTELRRQDRNTTVRLTDTMARIFANDSPAQALLGLSLAAIDMVGPARGVLAELMMYGRR
ncbi:UbiH/UbiF/VisC/COQ6 family ubiquinone biosynthesis hydroxylase [Rugamonas sp. FT82W]|uniref:UbiH/UbiF/VisC/COQ6 family ubiquinone biosynthesis hydroxylase n=1 Tax=Duganella vulcania TaxID=2692166 RepID=A0A845GD24_9BURK|nr:UbiH/UbiF/VisC/COQ6 family ubiquinone biosynthesis hydroxylase [Duganella vulcania]MYM91342.1 UbiH/UbiF/VisC/COQ6 family ubiquinone biosynthesis hydroxylase [Duganella vulcania]